MRDIKGVQQSCKCVLSIQAGIRKIAFLMFPFGKAAVVEALFGILDYERHDVVPETFLQRDQPANSAVPILEGVDVFEVGMEGNDVVDRDRALYVVGGKQPLHSRRGIIWFSCFSPADHVCALLVSTNGKPGQK